MARTPGATNQTPRGVRITPTISRKSAEILKQQQDSYGKTIDRLILEGHNMNATKMIKVTPETHQGLKQLAATLDMSIGETVEYLRRQNEPTTSNVEYKFSATIRSTEASLRHVSPFRSPQDIDKWVFTGEDLFNQIMRFINEYRGTNKATVEIDGMIIPVE